MPRSVDPIWKLTLTTDDPIPDTFSVPPRSASTPGPGTSTKIANQKKTHVISRYTSLSMVKDSAVVSTSDAMCT